MTAKILAGLLATVALTGVGIYAATGSVPGVESVASLITPAAPGGSCGSAASSCSMSAEATDTCPSLGQTESISVDMTECNAAAFGGVTAAMADAPVATAPTATGRCCHE